MKRIKMELFSNIHLSGGPQQLESDIRKLFTIVNQAYTDAIKFSHSRVDHLKELATLTNTGTILTGKNLAKKRQEIIKSLHNGDIRVLFSTLSLIGEGFDCPDMDTLSLSTPIKFSGRLKQVVGRVLRPAEGKKPLVNDNTDGRVGLLNYQVKQRQKVFATM